MKDLFDQFKQFISRGNVIELAVGVVIGASFNSVIQNFVKDIITPIIAAFGGQPKFSELYVTIHHSRFLYGDFLNTVLSFLIIAFIIFFFVVKPINTLIQFMQRNKLKESGTKVCPYCLKDIPEKATKCAYCTSTLSQPS